MFEIIFTNLALPCLIIDANGDVLAWNAAMYDLTDIKAEAAIGRFFGGSSALAALLEPQFLDYASKGIFAFDIKLSERSYKILWNVVPGFGWSIVFDDQQAARERDQHKTDMLNVVSHDLRTPLAAFKGYLELVNSTGALNEKQTHFWNRAQLAIQEMTELVDRLLDIAWIDAGMKLDINSLNLVELIRHTIERYTEWAKRQQVVLQLELEEIPAVQGDERRLKQVINNLVSNAIKYSPDGGTVTVVVRQISPDLVEFSVQDQGLGIPAEHLPYIFDSLLSCAGSKCA